MFVDNAQTDYTLLVRFVERGGFALHSARVETAAQLRAAVGNAAWDAVISELELPGLPLAEVLAVLRGSEHDLPLIVVTGTADEDAAADALVAGADDYVAKSRLARLLPALKRSLAAAAARRRERATQARLRLLQSQLDHANEVSAVARDLHDIFGELMTEFSHDFTWFAGNTAGAAAWARVQNMQQAYERARARAGHSLLALRPPLLEIGIVQALQSLAQRMLRRQGIACEFAANRTAVVLDEASFFAMYRACQESLALFARQPHSNSIRVELYAEARSVTLEVADDGVDADDSRFPILALRDAGQAVEALGGSLEVSSIPRHGTSVMVTLPLAPGA